MQESRIYRSEIRSYGAEKLMRVTGFAARYLNPTKINPQAGQRAFREILMPRAFRKAVAERQDVRFLVNHDPNRILGRTSSGTLRLRDSAQGLEFECDLPNTEDGRSTYSAVRRGDISECSFGFRMEQGDDEWSIEDGEEGRMAVRRIKNVSMLTDVSAVTFPAYNNTSIAARSENRSEIIVPKEFVVPVIAESPEIVARRRELLATLL